jgi:hypothetical protein
MTLSNESCKRTEDEPPGALSAEPGQGVERSVGEWPFVFFVAGFFILLIVKALLFS